MKVNKSLLQRYLSQSPKTEFFCILPEGNKLHIFFFTPKVIFFHNTIDVEEHYGFNNKNIFLDFNDFFSFISLSDQQSIEIEFKDNFINIICNRTSIKLSCLDGPEGDFIPKFESGEEITIPLFSFLENVNSHNKIIKRAPEICDNLIIICSDEEIRFQSTDIYRILVTKFIHIGNISNNCNAILSIPKIIVNFFSKNLKNFLLEESVLITRHRSNKNYLSIDLDKRTKIYFFEGKKTFSDFEKVKNRFSYQSYIDIKKDTLYNVLKEVEVISKTNIYIKYFSSFYIKKNEMIISSTNEKNNISSSIIPGHLNILEETKININTNMMNELINTFPDEEIRMFFQDSDSPVLIIGESGYEAIISVLSEI